MPGVDFDKLRTEITMEQVLNLLGFEPSRRSGCSGLEAVRCTSPGRGDTAVSR